MVVSNAGWAKKYYGFHQLAAQFLPIPDPTRPGEMLVTITMEQSQIICDQAYSVAEKFDLLQYFNAEPGKWGSLGVFGLTMGMVYIPKIKLARAILKMMKEQQRQQQQQPQTAADMVNPSPEQEAQQKASGVYKYGPN